MSFEKAVEFGKSTGPAPVVAVTRSLVVKLLMHKNQFGAGVNAGTDGPQAYADPRHALGRALPGPAEHQLLPGNDFLVDAADVMLLATGHAKPDVVAATDAHIELGQRDHAIIVGPEPPG
jgi:hypothetical protein